MIAGQKELLETLESLMSDLFVVCEDAFMIFEDDMKSVSINDKFYDLILKDGKYYLSRNNSLISLDKMMPIIIKEYKSIDWKKYKKTVKNAMLDWKEFYSGVKKKLEYL